MKVYAPFNFSGFGIKFEIFKIIVYFGSIRNISVILCFVSSCPLLMYDSSLVVLELLLSDPGNSLS